MNAFIQLFLFLYNHFPQWLLPLSFSPEHHACILHCELMNYPHALLRSFNKYLLSGYYVPGTGVVNKIKSLPSGLHIIIVRRKLTIHKYTLGADMCSDKK